MAAQHTDFTKGGKVFKTMASREDCIRQNCQTVMVHWFLSTFVFVLFLVYCSHVSFALAAPKSVLI